MILIVHLPDIGRLGIWCLGSPASGAQILQFYERQGLKLPQQPPLLMVKSAELGNAASREQHPSSNRSTPGRTAAGPVLHTRYLPRLLPNCLHPHCLDWRVTRLQTEMPFCKPTCGLAGIRLQIDMHCRKPAAASESVQLLAVW